MVKIYILPSYPTNITLRYVMNVEMKIGDVCRSCDITPRTVRYYEECDLITSEPKPDSTHRIYSAETVEKIKGIKTLQELGYSLQDIKKILALSSGTRTKDKWLTLKLRTELEREQQILAGKIEQLENKRQSIARIVKETSGCPDCPSKDCVSCDRLSTLRTLGF